MSAFVRRETSEIGWEDGYGTGPVQFSGGGRTKALRLSSVYAAVSLIADMFSLLPQHFYERTESARRKIPAPEWMRSRKRSRARSTPTTPSCSRSSTPAAARAWRKTRPVR